MASDERLPPGRRHKRTKIKAITETEFEIEDGFVRRRDVARSLPLPQNELMANRSRARHFLDENSSSGSNDSAD